MKHRAQRVLLPAGILLGSVMLVMGILVFLYRRDAERVGLLPAPRQLPPPIIVNSTDGPEEPPQPPKDGIVKSFRELRAFYGNKMDVNCGLRNSPVKVWKPVMNSSDYHTARVKPFDQPWLVQIVSRQLRTSDYSVICTGALISPEWMLTVRLCRYGLQRIEDGDQSFAVAGHVDKTLLGSVKIAMPRNITFLSGDRFGLIKLPTRFSVPVLEGSHILVNTICLPPPQEGFPAAVKYQKATNGRRVLEFIGHDTKSETEKFYRQIRLATDSLTHSCGLNKTYDDSIHTCGTPIPVLCRYSIIGSLLHYTAQLFVSQGPDLPGPDHQYRTFLDSLLSYATYNDANDCVSAIFRNVSEHVHWIAKTMREN